MIITSEAKVGSVWDYKIEFLEKNLPEEYKNIIDFKRIIAYKLITEEWTEKDYKDFTNEIRKMKITDFIAVYDLAVTIINISDENWKKELKSLMDKYIVNPNMQGKSLPYITARAIKEIQSKLYSVYRTPIEEEKTLSDNIESSIEYYEQLLKELNDENSPIRKVFVESFIDWVNETFVTEELRSLISNQETILLSRKKEDIQSRIRLLYSRKASIKNADINYHKKKVKETEIRGNSIRPMGIKHTGR